MCGIAGVYLKDLSVIDSANDVLQFDRFLDELFLGIEPRGRDSTGFVASRGTVIQLDKKAIPASDFIKTRRRAWMRNGTRIVLAHTRWATQGEPEFNQNNHPVMFGSTFITHNGHISNDDEVFDELKLDREDVAVDSVAIAATLEKHGFASKLPDALKLLRGSYAVAAINPKHHPDELLLIKGPSSPISYYENKYMLVWASLGTVIRDSIKEILGKEPKWSDVKTMQEGDVVHIKDGEVTLMPKHFKPYVYSSNWSGTGYTFGANQRQTQTPTTTTGVKVRTILNLIEPMRERRAEGKGVAITHERRKDMSPDQLKRHNGRFMQCAHCREWIAEIHMMDNPRWGKICVDCLAYALNSASKLPEAGLKQPHEWAGMTKDGYDFLLEYAEFEYELIDDAIKLVSERTGVHKELVFWMVFCADNQVLDNEGDAFGARLRDEYYDAEQHLTHGTFLEQDDSKEAEPDACEIIPPERQIEAPKQEPSRAARDAGMGKCDHCNRKAKQFNDGRRWCTRHANKCHIRGCKKNPVGYALDGKRLCHPHSRGVKQLTMLPKATAIA